MDSKSSTAVAVRERVDLATGEVTGIVPNAAFDMDAYIVSVVSDAAVQRQKALAAAYDRAVQALVGPNDVQIDGDRSFKKKSAWRKLARHFGISVALVSKRDRVVQNDETGRPELVVEVVARATAPWGQQMEAVGVCSTFEKRFAKPNAFQKRHADCFATAQTRASNRCVSDLIAAGEVSAEEMEGMLGADREEHAPRQAAPRPTRQAAPNAPTCPKCKGPMYDNRAEKEESGKRMPDFRCMNRECKDAKGYTTSIWKWEPPNEVAAPAAVQEVEQEVEHAPVADADVVIGKGKDRRRLGDLTLGELWDVVQRCDGMDSERARKLGAIARRLYDAEAAKVEAADRAALDEGALDDDDYTGEPIAD